MSTLSISPAFLDAALTPRRPMARLTRRGRLVLVLGFLSLVLLLTTVFGGWAAATHDHGSPAPVEVITVQSGETLYGIAGRLAGPGEVRSMVHRIQELNALPDTSLDIGQRLAVPQG